jgi:short-subunit dehydrogenase
MPNATQPPRWSRALVTGASSGIGAAFARRLAAAGTDVVLVARRVERLEDLAAEVASRHGVEAEVVRADLSDPLQVHNVAARLADLDRPVDLLVNNAGGHRRIAPFIEHETDHVVAEAGVNAFAVLELTHVAAREMVRRGRGTIIQVSAGTAFYPAPKSATYGASKVFVNSLSEAVAFELRDTPVGITVVCPGYTRTESPARLGFTEDNVPRVLWKDPERVVEVALRAAIRRRRIVQPGVLERLGKFIGYYAPRRVVLRFVHDNFDPNRGRTRRRRDASAG